MLAESRGALYPSVVHGGELGDREEGSLLQ